MGCAGRPVCRWRGGVELERQHGHKGRSDKEERAGCSCSLDWREAANAGLVARRRIKVGSFSALPKHNLGNRRLHSLRGGNHLLPLHHLCAYSILLILFPAYRRIILFNLRRIHSRPFLKLLPTPPNNRSYLKNVLASTLSFPPKVLLRSLHTAMKICLGFRRSHRHLTLQQS
ncbi:hypothetical protein K469DRAFT_66641 [Zopfia rhizophila CBS 207.26]|uniref:Uncharacterized protein n=1 Tax=Zopfia rhizophila CBS 207.26 TaxID=1314779 RepID=A0A6A6DCV7_9PEZI|nr:hypothetical protein K469DRAFT_66641 [Zopfia rhizophila CBS 207.26]